MSVVRGRPPGLAGGIIGASRAYCSSLRACPDQKSPPSSARLSAVHMACLREGLLPSRTADATAPPHARLDGASFSNGLSARLWPIGPESRRLELAVPASHEGFWRLRHGPVRLINLPRSSADS